MGSVTSSQISGSYRNININIVFSLSVLYGRQKWIVWRYLKYTVCMLFVKPLLLAECNPIDPTDLLGTKMLYRQTEQVGWAVNVCRWRFEVCKTFTLMGRSRNILEPREFCDNETEWSSECNHFLRQLVGNLIWFIKLSPWFVFPTRAPSLVGRHITKWLLIKHLSQSHLQSSLLSESSVCPSRPPRRGSCHVDAVSQCLVLRSCQSFRHQSSGQICPGFS